MKISKRKQEKIERLKGLILEFGEGDVSVERATEIATCYVTYKAPLLERIHDFFFDHLSLSQVAGDFVMTERFDKLVAEGKLS